MIYTYAIERSAAQAVFGASARERRLLQAAFEELALHPFQAPDLEEPGSHQKLFTRFFGSFAITYWIDHAIAEVRITTVWRD